MARIPTERVTVRLNRLHLSTIDALIQTGQYRNRTHAISEAVRDWAQKRSLEVKQIQESAKNQIDLQTVAAQLSHLQDQISKLSKK